MRNEVTVFVASFEEQVVTNPENKISYVLVTTGETRVIQPPRRTLRQWLTLLSYYVINRLVDWFRQ